MIVYQDLNPRGLASKEYGGLTYRLMIPLDSIMTDNELRHAIYYATTGVCTAPKYYTWTTPVNFDLMSRQAKEAKIKFVVNNATSLCTPNLTPELFGKTCGIIADLMQEQGWAKNNSAVALFNEPAKFLGHGTPGSIKYVEYVKRASDYVNGRYDLWIVNDEYNNDLLDFDYIMEHTTDVPGRIFCPHHLSSLGKTPAWQNVKDCKTRANAWGVPIGCSEGGAWFDEYRSPIGDVINKKLLAECKKYNYDFCCIVCIDNNEYTIAHTWGKLGYRIWNNDYSTNTRPLTEWDSWVEEITKYKKQIIKKEENMLLDDLYYKDRPEEKYVRDPDKRGVKFLRACFKLSDSNIFDAALDSEIRLYQASKGFLIDGKVGPITFGGLILEADYQKYYNWVQHDWATYS